MRQPVGLLSGGQRQALTLLMATMVPPPKLLLLDEHTAALDPPRRTRCWSDPAHRSGAPHHLSDGDPQHGAGPVSGQPHPDDGGGLHCAGCLRDRAGGAHGQ